MEMLTTELVSDSIISVVCMYAHCPSAAYIYCNGVPIYGSVVVSMSWHWLKSDGWLVDIWPSSLQPWEFDILMYNIFQKAGAHAGRA